MVQDYLKIGYARDLKDPKDRFLYRLLEILPGAVSWSTLILAVVLSWREPFFVAVFILVFDLYWLLRAFYFYFHLQAGYRKMKEHEKVDWLSKLKGISGWDQIYHLVILTFYHEPWEVLENALLALEKTDHPKEKIIIVLTCEERTRAKIEETVARAEEKFSLSFFKFLTTWHPDNLPGELKGKGANDHWGEIQAKEKIIDPLGIAYEKVIVSFFDVDTAVYPKYFSCLSWHYLTDNNPWQSSFQPIPLFFNNIWQAPFFSRVAAFASTFWNTLSQERPEKLITFSSHAMSFKTLVEVGFKPINMVSDDSRIFWQSFLRFNGDYRVQPLYYPVSMDANLAGSTFQTWKNIYKQQRRWAWGAEEIPYVFFNFIKNKKIPLRKKISQGLFLFESHWSWATFSLLIFALGWLPLVLGGRVFSQTLLAYSLPHLTSKILTVSMAGLFASVYLSFLLLPPRPAAVSRKRYLSFFLEWLVLPLAMIIFWTLPALEAQTRLMFGKYLGFWSTEKVRK